MDYSFPRYLLSKKTVDDRALNKDVLAALASELRLLVSMRPRETPLKVLEVGAGIGTMLTRLLSWNILPAVVEYTLVDELRENIDYARTWIPSWATQNGYQIETVNAHTFRLFAPTPRQLPASAAGQVSSISKPADEASLESIDKFFDNQSVLLHLTQADVLDFTSASSIDPLQESDLLIAHAFLDLLPMPASLPKLFSLVKPNGLAWLTINFDGVTTFEPAIHLPASESIDKLIERLYHHSMDTRPTGGDSQSGRHLFGHLKQVGAEIVSAGTSDWVVFSRQGHYPADEAYFLHFILHFFETSLSNHPELDPKIFAAWLAARRAQIDRGELVYIAHQLDFLCKTPISLPG